MTKFKEIAKCAFFERSGAIAIFLSITSVVIFGVVSPAHAQQTDADFSAYCRANYSNSSYRSFVQSWGTEHACVQGGTRQGIDLAEACFITTGNRNYEISGIRVFCEGSSADAPAMNLNDIGSPNLNQYCVDNFPNSSYERRAEASGYEHYCRRPGVTGGFTLQPINLFQACQVEFGTQEFRKDGVQIFCVSESNASTTPDSGGSGGSGPARPVPFPLPNGGSGAVPPMPPLPLPTPVPAPAPENAPSPESSGDDPTNLACQTMGGEWRGGTLDMVDGFIAEMDEALQQRLSSCDFNADMRDFCRKQVITEQVSAAYFQTLMIYQCHLSFFQYPEGKSGEDIKMAVSEACAIEPTLNELLEKGNSTGFIMPPLHYMVLNEPDMDAICDCDPEIPDFAARVREMAQQSEKRLIEEFAE